MPANVVKSPNRTTLLATNNEAFARDFLQEIVAWGRNLILMPHTQPLRGKDPLQLERENFRGNEITLRQGFCAGREGLSRSAKLRHRSLLRVRHSPGARRHSIV